MIKIKLTINISNKISFTILVVLIGLILGLSVYAVVPNPGHPANQIEEGTIGGTLTISGGKVGVKIPSGQTPSGDFDIRGTVSIIGASVNTGFNFNTYSTALTDGFVIARIDGTSGGTCILNGFIKRTGVLEYKRSSLTYTPFGVLSRVTFTMPVAKGEQWNIGTEGTDCNNLAITKLIEWIPLGYSTSSSRF